MATTKLQMQYDIYQNSNEDSTAFGKWYPRAVQMSTLNLKGLANHIKDHGSVYTQDIVLGVITKFRDCLVELVSQGVGVKLDGLGTFYPTLESKGAETPVNYNLESYLQGIHIRFRPEGAGEEKLTSRVFKKQVPMKQRLIFDKNGKPKKVVDGQLVDYGTEE